MKSYNLFSHFSARFTEFLDRPFLIGPGRAVLTYADLIETTGKLANVFQSLGIRAGDRIALQAEKSAECVLVYLAALRVGAVYLPLNPGYTVTELRQLLADAEPRVLICAPSDVETLTGVTRELGIGHLLTLGGGGTGTLMERAGDASSAFEDIVCLPDDLAAILYTSGTTGRPKGAMLTHDNLRSNAETLREAWRFDSEDRLLHALPVFHTHGLFVAVNVTLASCAAMIFLPRFDVPALLRHMPDATVMMGVPTFYVRLLEDPGFTNALTRHMRLFVSGSAPLGADTHRSFAERTGHAILERYGMTETNMNTSNPYEGDRVPGSVGPPLPGVEVRIAGAADEGDGVIGRVEVRGPNVFRGYWRMPEKTAEDFTADGFFITGDLGICDARGYIHIVGREKDLIITGGFNVYPAEVEQAIEALLEVAECAVIGVPDQDMGEAVVAVIRRAPGHQPDERAILAAIADDLARYKLPRRVHFVADLPRNAMGKIQKNDLRSRFAGVSKDA